ncbi:MAG TPA: dipeptide epimerase [Actinomycetota bacterium]|nr:dipeptide epimerase [Actinomycetota bacterium]
MTAEKWILEATSVDLPLKERFTIARHTWDSARNVFAVVRHGDLVGRGEASPSERWGESVDSVLDQLAGVDLDAALHGPYDLEAVSGLLPAGSARAVLDVALHDLAAARAGVSVGALLGVAGRPLPPTSVTVPIWDPDAMVERARALADYPVLKMKVGFDGDVDALAAVRTVYPGTIRVDANEGWDADEAIERLRALERFDVELCEQPVPAGRPDDLRRVREGSPIPVVADEDVHTAADVARLAGVVDGVNLKLRKTGGIREMMRAIAVARAHGMLVMIGCDLESGIAASAGAHVAALADVVDLDGPWLLARDPFPGVRYDHGHMTLPDAPGLGVTEVPA